MHQVSFITDHVSLKCVEELFNKAVPSKAPPFVRAMKEYQDYVREYQQKYAYPTPATTPMNRTRTAPSMNESAIVPPRTFSLIGLS